MPYADTAIKTMSNKELLQNLKKHKSETDYPEKHTRYVTTKQFWGSSGISKMKKELAKRKKSGKLRSTAGVAKKKIVGFQGLW